MSEIIGYIRFPKYCASEIEIKDEVSLDIAKQLLEAIEKQMQEKQVAREG